MLWVEPTSSRKRYRCLVVEDERNWREDVRDTIAQTGIEVVAVATRDAAADRLASEVFHLLILDIHLEDHDPSNVEGMEFLRELSSYGISEALSVVVLTAVGSEDMMREAFREHGVEDFVSKYDYQEDEDGFLATVEGIFRNKLRINLDLAIHWNGVTPEAAVLNLLMGDSRVKRDTPQLAQIARELEDLFCRLFSGAESLSIEPLGTGRSGAGVLLAQPFFEKGDGGRQVVVKFGDVARIQQERDNFDRYVVPYLGGGRHTSLQVHRRGPRLGGIVYSLLGKEGHQLSNFATFYRGSSGEEVHRVLEGLFRETCGTWYKSPGKTKLIELTPYYFQWLGMSPEGLERGLKSLKSVQGMEDLYFQGLGEDHRWTHPLTVFPENPMAFPTYETLTHGDFHPENILLDGQGNSWLIDFQGTGPGHFLRDAVELDAAIRIGLLAPDDATLDERLGLERALAASRSFSDPLEEVPEPPGSKPAVIKAFHACLQLRRLAGEFLAAEGSAGLDEYLAGTLFCALNLTRFLSLPTLTREHALLSACVLTERLGY